METGKTGKYFKYAIGEIILVVIGILIALSINNWNELRQQKNEEITILKAIKSDFNNAIAEFNELNQNRVYLLKTYNQLYEIIKEKEYNYSNDKLDKILASLLISPTYNSQTKTLEVLFNSGKMSIISNESIKNKLINWPKLVEDMKEGELEDNAILREKIIPLIMSYVSFFDLNRKFEFKNYKLFDKSLQSVHESNYEGLLKNRDFENVLSLRELYTKVAEIETSALIKEIQSIVELIDYELNNSK